jgi:hypothetical protein
LQTLHVTGVRVAVAWPGVRVAVAVRAGVRVAVAGRAGVRVAVARGVRVGAPTTHGSISGE